MQRTLFAAIQLMRLDKPIGILLLLWPTLWAFSFVDNVTWSLVAIFIAGVILMRSAGCVINDLADQRFDGHVKRTCQRPLVSGAISRQAAYSLFFVLIACAASLLLFLPLAATYFAIIALLTALLYPLMKRFTHLPQLLLGVAFSWGIPMVYASTSGHYPLTCWLLFFANLLWTVAYDTMYAMVDREDDLKIGVKSTAILFGRYDRGIIGALQLGVLSLFCVIGVINALSWLYFCGVLLVAGLFLYQQRLIATRQRTRCFQAFLNNHWVGCLLFIALQVGNSSNSLF